MAKAKTYQLGEVLEFGKYADKGMTMEEIINIEPRWIQICIKQMFFKLSPGAERKLMQRCSVNPHFDSAGILRFSKEKLND